MTSSICSRYLQSKVSPIKGGWGWGLFPIGLKSSPLCIHECNIIFIFLKVNEKGNNIQPNWQKYIMKKSLKKVKRLPKQRCHQRLLKYGIFQPDAIGLKWLHQNIKMKSFLRRIYVLVIKLRYDFLGFKMEWKNYQGCKHWIYLMCTQTLFRAYVKNP